MNYRTIQFMQQHDIDYYLYVYSLNYADIYSIKV